MKPEKEGTEIMCTHVSQRMYNILCFVSILHAVRQQAIVELMKKEIT